MEQLHVDFFIETILPQVISAQVEMVRDESGRIVSKRMTLELTLTPEEAAAAAEQWHYEREARRRGLSP